MQKCRFSITQVAYQKLMRPSVLLPCPGWGNAQSFQYLILQASLMVLFDQRILIKAVENAAMLCKHPVSLTPK